ncbi:glycosyltransferase family 4 protein [Bacillus sp. FJAT-49705]|uniref:Glycosyltransferase family 4 protein n=1 Tax=Cytobacillus citreus TaxID=2833586 RepID=A0ABS5NXR5_9BACI|nr:glycosyltransferase family 4 protein [Cytobacillus citreus]MBS4192613.1 glycosyltransferase family 4 protein [Cytobacillus citreus]
MRIWILNHHAVKLGRHPGFAKYLTKLGAQVSLFSASFLHNQFVETKDYGPNEFFIKENESGYDRVHIKTPKYYTNGKARLWNQIVFAYRAYKSGIAISKKEGAPDVILGSSVHLFTGLAAYFLSKKLKAKFVFEIRDLWPQTLIDLGALKEKSPVTKVFQSIEKFLYKKADKIISVLPNADEYITRLGIKKEKILYIPNGIDLDWHRESMSHDFTAEEAKQFFEKYQDHFIITFAGSHGTANGLDTVVKAAPLLAAAEEKHKVKTQILLLGEGPEKNNLINMFKQTGCSNITFLNKVDRTQVPHILNQSDLCLFHLKYTPVFKYGISSNKLFDYMLSKKPMIFAVDTSYDFAKEAECGVSIQPDMPEKLVESILYLKNSDQEKRVQMGLNGEKFVEENHSLEKLAEKMYKAI